MKKEKKTISFSVDLEAYREILSYATVKGHGGQFPTSTFAHYAVFQMMKKYPLSEAEKRKIECRDGKGRLRSKAVQPEALRGIEKKG